MNAKYIKAWETDFDEIYAAIVESCLSEDLDEQSIGLLSKLGRRIEYTAGEIIVNQDDEDSSLLILAKGRAEIRSFMDEPLYFLSPGMPFGEVALIDEKPRSATVTACEATEVILLPADELRRLMYAHPELGLVVLRNLARVLCARVRASNQQIAVLQTLEELREKRV
jgi:glutaminase